MLPCGGVGRVASLIALCTATSVGCAGPDTVDEPVPVPGKVSVDEVVVRTQDRCPEITAWDASPLETSVFSFIDVTVTATDPDVGVVPGETLSFWWSGGLFATPDASTTRYRCQTGGAHLLKVTVSDNHVPGPCAASVTLPVRCLNQ